MPPCLTFRCATPLSGICVFILLLILMFIAPPVCRAQSDPLPLTANRLADQFVGNPSPAKEWFSAAFLKAVPEMQLTEIFRSLHAKYGPVLNVIAAPDNGPASGKFTFECTDVQIPLTLNIEATAPFRIVGLRFGNPVSRLKSLDEVKKRLAALPGKVAFLIQSLDDDKPLVALNPDEPLAIGSAFKLYILAELLRQNVPWDKTLTVDPRYKSLPSGDMAQWPDSSPATVDTFALKMISQSDNTAADHLLHLVTREKVEAALPELGNKNAAANMPFLSTLELFRLKSDAAAAKEFLAGDASAKAKLLARMATEPKPDISKFATGDPLLIDRIEWFASPADLCRLMQWFDNGNNKTALEILAVNPGLAISKTGFPYVGFKGGSEPGVLNLTYLLHSKSHHYAIAASWNNAKKDVDLEQFAGLLLAAIELIEPAAPATGP